jgi:hypothetical protein
MPPHHSSKGGPVATREPTSSMGISREWSQIPMESHTRIESPSDRVEHDHPFSLPSLSRQPSTYAHPYSGISTGSRAELNHLGSVRPEGPRGGEQAEQQGDGVSRETRTIVVGRDVPTDIQPLQQRAAESTHDLASLSQSGQLVDGDRSGDADVVTVSLHLCCIFACDP